jgi:hypothetical protein
MTAATLLLDFVGSVPTTVSATLFHNRSRSRCSLSHCSVPVAVSTALLHNRRRSWRSLSHWWTRHLPLFVLVRSAIRAIDCTNLWLRHLNLFSTLDASATITINHRRRGASILRTTLPPSASTLFNDGSSDSRTFGSTKLPLFRSLLPFHLFQLMLRLPILIESISVSSEVSTVAVTDSRKLFIRAAH